LLTKYDAHINVEICNSVLTIKYLYKYIYKGYDRATITLSKPVDKIKIYLNARYVSSSEAVWQIFHYKMHGRSPNVQRLVVHLSEHQIVNFRDDENLQQVLP